MTDAEVMLWSEPKGHRKDGAHFRRQVPIGRYVADFACHRNRLIIEIDGSTHTTDEAIARDARRTAFLEGCGYRVLRFTNDDVYRTCRAVIDAILAQTHQERPERGRSDRGTATDMRVVLPPPRGRWRGEAVTEGGHDASHGEGGLPHPDESGQRRP